MLCLGKRVKVYKLITALMFLFQIKDAQLFYLTLSLLADQIYFTLLGIASLSNNTDNHCEFICKLNSGT